MKPVLSTSLYDQNVRTVVTFKPMNAMIKPTLRVRPEPFAPRRHTMPRAASPSLPTPDPTDGRRTAVPVPATETKATHLADDAATRAMMASAMRSVAVAAARHRRRVTREERATTTTVPTTFGRNASTRMRSDGGRTGTGGTTTTTTTAAVCAAAEDTFRALCLGRRRIGSAGSGGEPATVARAWRKNRNGRYEETDDDDEEEEDGEGAGGAHGDDDGDADGRKKKPPASRLTNNEELWDGKTSTSWGETGTGAVERAVTTRKGRKDYWHEIVPACEDGGTLEMCTFNVGDDMDGGGTSPPRPLVVWAHGMRGDLSNDDAEGLWNFWAREDLGPCGVVRYNARGYGKSSDVLRTRQARWENRASDMIEVVRRVRGGDGGDFVLSGASLGAATSIWATVLCHENGLDLPKAVVVVTPPTFYEERESRKKKLKEKVLKGGATENSTAPRRIFQAARDLPVTPAPPPLANPNDSCAVEVLIGSAQSNLPEHGRVRAAFADVPVLCLAWDCGDGTHPVSSAMTIKDLIPHAELVVASSSEDYDIVKHVREHWSPAIGEFIQREVVEKLGV